MANKIFIYIKMLKLHRIINAFSIFRKEGLAGVKYHFYLVKDKEKRLGNDCSRKYDITPILENKAKNEYKGKRESEYPPLSFEEHAQPMVSIIIPVYNQFAYTYRCLEHIKKYSSNIAYEIIIGDDCSFDRTRDLEKMVRGAKVIHNKENYQFLINCNHISREAKGKYLVFLNNDTQVQQGWLDALVSLMEKDKTIGLAGSKLIYPNGLVQEAGGIVWKDATVLQFGNNRQPGERELNIKREVDYISGASIIIRKKLWNEIGGFDERFAPAYYEDVDLAFQIREKGYKVIYQPESEVVHFEGATEGMDMKQKERIEENREIFYVKWKRVLEERHYEPSGYKKMIREMREYR